MTKKVCHTKTYQENAFNIDKICFIVYTRNTGDVLHLSCFLLDTFFILPGCAHWYRGSAPCRLCHLIKGWHQQETEVGRKGRVRVFQPLSLCLGLHIPWQLPLPLVEALAGQTHPGSWAQVASAPASSPPPNPTPSLSMAMASFCCWLLGCLNIISCWSANILE